MPVSVRECVACGYIKPRTSVFFSPERRGEFKAKCRSCRARESAIYYLFHRDKCLSQQQKHYANGGGKQRRKEWRTANPRKVLHTKLQSTYGISLDEYEALATRQGHRCAICRRKKKLYVDHCHATSQVRGLLCHHCNAAIGLFLEDVQALQRAQEYLRPSGISAPQNAEALGVLTA